MSDRRLDPSHSFNRDPRSASAPRLADALLAAGDDGLTFDELLEASATRNVSDVAAWIGRGAHDGLVEQFGLGRDTRFRLRPHGARIVTAGRRRDDADSGPKPAGRFTRAPEAGDGAPEHPVTTPDAA